MTKVGIPHEKSQVGPIVTLSAGAACGEVAVTGDVDTILKAADDSLYVAKKKGRNQVCGLDTMKPVNQGLEAEQPGDLPG